MASNSKQPTLYMLIGVPGSGKSTWIARKTDRIGYQWTLLSTDEYIEFKAKEEEKLYHEVFHKHIKDAEKMLDMHLQAGIEQNIDIYWDQTNLTAKNRAKKLAKIPEHYRKVAVVFELDDDHLQYQLDKRCKETGKWINPDVVAQMKKNFEFPSRSEGFDEIQMVIIRKPEGI